MVDENGFTGSVPLLRNVKVLWMQGNGLTGTVPEFVGRLNGCGVAGGCGRVERNCFGDVGALVGFENTTQRTPQECSLLLGSSWDASSVATLSTTQSPFPTITAITPPSTSPSTDISKGPIIPIVASIGSCIIAIAILLFVFLRKRPATQPKPENPKDEENQTTDGVDEPEQFWL
ncbi:hypothetical protein BC829DRAFT_141786 [Chytridium lagenaria]|nr:hypothetical protein BC829DRAFT_141786 [Chytridium lagenaria]